MGVRPSMGTVGDAFDNAMAKSFFASLECELIDRKTFKTRTEARLAVLPGSKAGITPGDVIARWDTYHLLISKGDRQRLFLNLISRVRARAHHNDCLGIKSITIHENGSTPMPTSPCLATMQATIPRECARLN
jgi:hypothetical protein